MHQSDSVSFFRFSSTIGYHKILGIVPSVCVCALSCPVVSGSLRHPWTVARQASLSMWILQARILEWVAVPSSRGSSQTRDQTHIFRISCIGRWVLFPLAPTGNPEKLIRHKCLDGQKGQARQSQDKKQESLFHQQYIIPYTI